MLELLNLFSGFIQNTLTAISSVEIAEGVNVIGIIFASFLVCTVVRLFVG